MKEFFAEGRGDPEKPNQARMNTMTHMQRNERRRKLQLLLLASAGVGAVGAQINPMFADEVRCRQEPVLQNITIEDCCPPSNVVPNDWTGMVETTPQIKPESEKSSALSAEPDLAADPDFLIGPELGQPLSNFDQVNLPTANSLASNTGSRGGLDAPNMMGDLFLGGGTLTTLGTVAFGGERRFKITENVSPKPQDRVYFNYNLFSNALESLQDGSADLHGFSFGFEKTFLDEMVSFEARLPFARTLSSTQFDAAGGDEAVELGNMQFAFKCLLFQEEDFLISGGTTWTVPTGDDYRNNDTGIENEAYHLAPFLGLLSQSDSGWFQQAFVQADFDLNGNTVIDRNTDTIDGVYHDQSLLFLSYSIGQWLYQDTCQQARLKGIAGQLELHYTTTLQDFDEVGPLTTNVNRVDALNFTSALNFLVGKTAIRVGAVAPLRDGDDKLFDAEFQLQVNRFF